MTLYSAAKSRVANIIGAGEQLPPSSLSLPARGDAPYGSRKICGQALPRANIQRVMNVRAALFLGERIENEVFREEGDELFGEKEDDKLSKYHA